MFNRRFMDLVRHQLIQTLATQANQRQDAAPPALRYGEGDVVAFVDLQNLHFFLRHNCHVAPTQVHIPALVRDFASAHGMEVKEIHIFTGIHDYKREPAKHESMRKRLAWLRKNGCNVTALPLHYFQDRRTGEPRFEEKGVDVRITSAIFRAVTEGLCRALVFSQDADIGEGVHAASEMAAERGRRFVAFSPYITGMEWEANGRCGTRGISGTERLELSVEMVRRHTRPDLPNAPAGQEPQDPSPIAQEA